MTDHFAMQVAAGATGAPAPLELEPAIDTRRTPPRYLAAFALALVGGVFGIVGAFVEEVRAGFSPLIPVVGAPIIEEILKPSGLYVVVARWPRLFDRQLYISFLAALGGLTFGLIESAVYATVYVDHPSHAFLLFRFTVPVMLHVTASFIAGWGIRPELWRWANSGGKFPKVSRNAFLAAMALHATYNAVVIALAIAGLAG
jgi:hypothetical protein